MYIEQLHTGGLSVFSYYLESDGFAAIVDPMRNVDRYLDIANSRNAEVKYIFETHFHADFISGHLELAQKTGAEIIFGPSATADFAFHCAFDGEKFELGSVTLKLLHTPGHTLESSCLLLFDERNNPHSVFTGDTLFVDDVGRPDLIAGASKTKEDLAEMLYDSIHSKLLNLPNYVNVYPSHGAGSACGKSIGSAPHSNIGIQKKTNIAFKTHDKIEFVRQVLEGLNPLPKYFHKISEINRKGYSYLEEIILRNSNELSVDEVVALAKSADAIIIDTRTVAEFSRQFIPNSISISLEGPLAATIAALISPDKNLIIVAEENFKKEILFHLASVGFEKVAGFLSGGISSWINSGNAVDQVQNISAEEFAERFRYNSCNVIDVRNPDEWVPGFVSGAKLISLSDLESKIPELDPNKTCFVYCTKGCRSMIAASLLKRKGFTTVIHVSGGMNKIKKTEISIRQLASFAV
jgi:hydroxyacylglutathione hydrolase